MERKRILFAVNAPSGVLDLRKSLVTAGYEVKIVDNGAAALILCREFRPHLLCAEKELSKIDGHHLFRELKTQSATKNIAFVLLSKHRSVDERVHSIDLGVDDYITQPFDVEEVLVRFEIIMREVETFEAIPKNNSKGFSGKLSDLNLVELLQTLEIAEKSGTIKLQRLHSEAIVSLKKGQVLNATLGTLSPKEALFRIFTWNDGTFRVDFKPVEQEKLIEESTSILIAQGFKYLDVWAKISSSLPSLRTTVQAVKSASGTLSGEQKAMLSLVDKKTTLLGLVEGSDFGDLVALKILANLYKKGAIGEMPTDEIQNDGSKTTKRSSAGSQISDLIANFLSPDSGEGGVQIERREGAERRENPRRWTDYVREKNQIHLNKSELLMIREKLADGKSKKNLLKNLS